jgi:glutathione-specific gamma-glutamylcyclotransferase
VAVNSDLWIFGYGSLIFRPDFPFSARCQGYITGWTRRFWQASPDHRGTPQQPGRVATIIVSPQEQCWGVAYRVAEVDRARVLEQLDERERGGYERKIVPFYTSEAALRCVERVVVYIADHTNPNYVGPEDTQQIADIVREARGLSGANREYVLRLAAALTAMGAIDPHVFELARAIALDNELLQCEAESTLSA